MKYICFSLLLGVFLLFSCSSSDSDTQNQSEKTTQNGKFKGNYNKAFNDLHDLHIAAATANGISPLATRDAATKMGNKLVLIPQELPIYKTDKLTHSSPYLVPKASELVVDICKNFRDSLISKNIPLYKPILTSLTRTDEDVKKLTKRNSNASHNSAHCYGTTFDISWKRFEKIDSASKDVSVDKLKYVLAEVLFDLKQEKRCYIKHEKKQACFHITVR